MASTGLARRLTRQRRCCATAIRKDVAVRTGGDRLLSVDSFATSGHRDWVLGDSAKH
jgi:hypothetical protein